MRQTFCVKFYCREAKVRKDGIAPVEVSVIVNGERQMWQLPKSCKPQDFKTNKDIKLYCTAIENKLNEIYTNLTINNEPVTSYIIKDIYYNGNDRKSYTIAKMFEDGLKLKAMENGDISTYRKYENVTKRFYKLTGKQPQQEANSVNYTDIITFKAGVEKIHQSQTVFKEMQHLKYFFNLAFNSGKIKQNPFGTLKIKHGEKDKPYLTQEEIQAIKDLKITNDRLDKVRDVFLFLCYTGIEWADLINLKKEDVQLNKLGQYYIKKPRIKTGITYVSVLYADAIDVWKLYEGNLPLISPQKFNKYLKELSKSAKIDKNVTSLTARHSYAVFLLSDKKISMEVVQKMLGHASIKETHVYAKLLDNAVFEANNESEKEKGNITPHRETRAEMQADMDDIEAFNKLLGI